MTNSLLHPSLIEMLKEMEEVFVNFDVDFYLVGAVARDIWLAADPEMASIRKTKDVDIAVMINDEGQFYKLKEALISTQKFEAHQTEAIKLLYKNSIEVDLLPFGEIEESNRVIRLTDPFLFVLNMPGFKEIHPFVENIQISDSLTISVCSIEGIVLLKLISNDDRPHRTKDISDIEHIIKMYFDLNNENIYENHFDTMSIYDTADSDYLQLVSSRIIGRKIALLLTGSAALKERIKGILDKRPTTWWQAMLAGMNDR